jgi:hypothetical protein
MYVYTKVYKTHGYAHTMTLHTCMITQRYTKHTRTHTRHQTNAQKYYNTDIKECSNGTHNCDTHANCSETPGSFACTCLKGWTPRNGSYGVACDDIDECYGNGNGSNPCTARNATCMNTNGSYACVCGESSHVLGKLSRIGKL